MILNTHKIGWLVIPLLLLFTLNARVNDDAREANKAYEKGKYEEAEKLYRHALQEEPENAKVHFNLANALVKQGEYKEAAGLYQQFITMTDNKELRARAEYNLGNIFSSQKKFDKAVLHYRNSLRMKPDDAETKHNYELALRNQKQQQQDKDQQNDNKNKNENKDKQDQKNKDQNKDKKDQQDQNKQQNKDKKQDNKDDQQQNQNQNQDQQKQNKKNDKNKQKQKSQPQPNKISKADAQKILNALADKEKDLLKKFKKKETDPKNKNGKDW